MSTVVEIKIGGDLENPRARDLAEHVCKLVREAVEKAAADTPGSIITVGVPMERKKSTYSRRFDQAEEFRQDWGEERFVAEMHLVYLPTPEKAEETKEAPPMSNA